MAASSQQPEAMPWHAAVQASGLEEELDALALALQAVTAAEVAIAAAAAAAAASSDAAAAAAAAASAAAAAAASAAAAAAAAAAADATGPADTCPSNPHPVLTGMLPLQTVLLLGMLGPVSRTTDCSKAPAEHLRESRTTLSLLVLSCNHCAHTSCIAPLT